MEWGLALSPAVGAPAAGESGPEGEAGPPEGGNGKNQMMKYFTAKRMARTYIRGLMVLRFSPPAKRLMTT